jgi:hypothetical protein
MLVKYGFSQLTLTLIKNIVTRKKRPKLWLVKKTHSHPIFCQNSILNFQNLVEYKSFLSFL